MRGETRIAEIAARQCGVVARRQLLAAGVDRHRIDRMIRASELHPVHRGVYLVGHEVAPAGAQEVAAALACGPAAYVSHRSAAVLHNLLPHPAESAPIHITTTSSAGRPGLVVHRVAVLPPDEVGHLRGIPLTSPSRTLIDLAASGSRELEQALAEAQAQGLITEHELLARASHRRGSRELRRLLEAGPALTRSEAERRLLDLIRRAGLPRPATNVRRGGIELDFLWPEERLVVEVDGFAYHGRRSDFERDRRRDARLAAEGFTVVRVTWRQLARTPEAVIAALAGAIATRRVRSAR